MTYSIPDNYKDRPIVVIGAGTLGMRIALMMATQGNEVRIYDTSVEQQSKAIDFIQKQLSILLDKHDIYHKGEVISFKDLAKAVENAWIIFEVIPEKLELKQELFKKLDRLAPADAILASNSSSFPCSEFIEGISEDGKKRIVNVHFSMPPIQNVVEIMGSKFTDGSVIKALLEILPRYGGLVPFEVRKESVGFIFNRVWAAIKRECLEIVASGISTPEEVDRIFMVNTGIPVGPFREMDMIGLDVILEIEEHYATLNPHLPQGPRELLRKYVSEGRLGVKNGHGFYSYKS